MDPAEQRRRFRVVNAVRILADRPGHVLGKILIEDASSMNRTIAMRRSVMVQTLDDVNAALAALTDAKAGLEREIGLLVARPAGLSR